MSRKSSRSPVGRGALGRECAASSAEPRLPLGEPPVRPTFARERAAIKRGMFPVAGCDEAGRGPLAGPVVAAAVILDPNRIPRGLNDSKKLTAAEREKLYGRIFATSEVGIAFGSPARIDRDNIRRASLWALARAVAALAVRPRLVFVDGIDRIEVGCDCVAVVSGDALVLSIAAASIVAKVVRDRIMMRLDRVWPDYGFAQHKGYGTPEHLVALDRHGPCPLHRYSFRPIGQTELDLADALEPEPIG